MAGSGSLSYSQIRKLWLQAGGNRAWSYVMAAVAMAESSGVINPPPHVNANGSIDYGLWQINSVHGYNVNQLRTDPAYNARAAVSIFNSGGAKEWTTFTSGAYKKYMPTSASSPSTSSFGIYTKGDFLGVDQGVDFSGKGAIPALDNALVTDVGRTTIVETGNKEWNYVIYLLREGPYKGHYVYVSENFQPTVHIGQIVQKGQSIGTAGGSYPYTETGFNKGGKGWSAYGNLNGPQIAGQQMQKYIFGLIGAGIPVTSTSTTGSDVGQQTGQITNAITGAVSGWFSGIESLILQGFFILIGIGLIVVGLGLVAWTVMGKVGAPGIVGMAQSQMRIRQAGARTTESQRASMVRESQAGERIQAQERSRQLSERRLKLQEENASRRQEKYVVKDKPNQVVRKKPGKPASGVPR